MAIRDWFRREKREANRVSYTNYLLGLQLQGANANQVNTAATTAVEAVAGLLSRTLAGSDVVNGPPGATPEWLALVGRELITRGESVSYIDSQSNLIPVGTINWEVTDSSRPELEENWTARVTMNHPSGSLDRVVGRGSLVVIRWGRSSQQPHIGAGGASWASLGAEALAQGERSMRDDLSTPVSHMLVAPEGINMGNEDNDPLAMLAKDINSARGGVFIAESMADGYGLGESKGPHRDWATQRMGPQPNAAQVEAVNRAFSRMCAALGCNHALFSAGADGTAQREALRRWYLFTVKPIAKLIASEINARFDGGCQISLEPYGTDLQARAASFRQLVQGGMEVGEAAAVSGVLTDSETV